MIRNSKLKDMLAVFARNERNDKSIYWHLRDKHVKYAQWMQDAAHKAHGDKFPDDTVYEYIKDALRVLLDTESSEEEFTSEDDIEDAINQIEADIYTHDLTEWLHRRPDHVYYLTEALESGMVSTDGFQLLMVAQLMQKQEIARALYEALKEDDDDEGDEGDGDEGDWDKYQANKYIPDRDTPEWKAYRIEKERVSKNTLSTNDKDVFNLMDMYDKLIDKERTERLVWQETHRGQS